MSKESNTWKKRGFDDKHHYAGWLYFNGLTDESRMYDDVYYDPYSGQVINIVETESDSEKDHEEDISDDE